MDYNESEPLFRSAPRLDESDRFHDEVDRSRTGAIMMGVCAVVFAIVCLVMLQEIPDDPTTTTVILYPLGLFLVCLLSALFLANRAGRAAKQLERIEAEERAERWREAQHARDSEPEHKRVETSSAYDHNEPRDQKEARVRDDARRVSDLRARYERGILPAVQAPISLSPGETCFYVCTCVGKDARVSDEDFCPAQLVVTSQRLVVVDPVSIHLSRLSDILRFSAIDDCTVRLWLADRLTAYDLIVDYPLETVAYLLIAFKVAGITPPRPSAGQQAAAT
jgi:hypothetical protein